AAVDKRREPSNLLLNVAHPFQSLVNRGNGRCDRQHSSDGTSDGCRNQISIAHAQSPSGRPRKRLRERRHDRRSRGGRRAHHRKYRMPLCAGLSKLTSNDLDAEPCNTVPYGAGVMAASSSHFAFESLCSQLFSKMQDASSAAEHGRGVCLVLAQAAHMRTRTPTLSLKPRIADMSGTTSAPPCRRARPSAFSRNGILWNASPETKLLRFDTRELDHLGPLLGFACDHLGELSRRSRQRLAAEVGKPRLDLGIGEASVDRPVERFDNLCRRALRRTEAAPEARLITRQEVDQGRDFRECLRARGGGHRQSP